MRQYDLAKKKKSEQGLLEAFIIADMEKKTRREQLPSLEKEIFNENRCNEPEKRESQSVIIIEL